MANRTIVKVKYFHWLVDSQMLSRMLYWPQTMIINTSRQPPLYFSQFSLIHFYLPENVPSCDCKKRVLVTEVR